MIPTTDLAPDLAAAAANGEAARTKLTMDNLNRTLASGQTGEKKLREACQGFESVFINKLISQMRATVPKDGFLHGPYEDQYLAIFDQHLSEKLAAEGGIGLADMMYRQLKDRVAGKKDGQEPGQGENQAQGENPGGGEPEIGDVLPANRTRSLHSAHERMPFSADAPKKGQTRIFYEQLRGASELRRPEAAGDVSRGAAREAALAQANENLAAPARGAITSDYGWRADPFTGQKAWHAGMDIAAPKGAPVSACWDGRVVFAGEKGGYGKVVMIEHEGGFTSVYGHLDSIGTRVGDVVGTGREIAKVGETGRATGPHLHFELRRDTGTVDPASYLATGHDAPTSGRGA